MKGGRYAAEGLVLLLIAMHVLSNTVWFARHTDPPLGNTWGFDVRWHLANAFIFKSLLAQAYEEGGVLSMLSALLETFRIAGHDSVFALTWPRLTYLVAVPFATAFGDSGAGIEASSTLWLAILITFTYLVGTLINGKLTGVIAAYLVSIYPCFFGLSREFGLDLPLAAMVAVTCFLLLQSDSFSRRRWSIGFGLALGLGFFTKMQIMLFVLPVVGLVAGQLVASRWIGGTDRPGARQRAFNLGLALLLAAAFCLFYLWGVLSKIPLVVLWPFRHGETSLPGQIGTVPLLSGLRFYLGGAFECTSPLLFVAFLIGAPFGLGRRAGSIRGVLLVWLLGSVVLFSAMQNQQQRFLFPAFPVIALLTASGGVTCLRAPIRWQRWLGRVVLGGALLWGAVQYVGISFAGWGVEATWGWARGVQNILLGDRFESGLSWAFFWSPPPAEVRSREKRHLQAVDAILKVTGPSARIGIIGPERLRQLEYAWALRTGRAFALKVVEDIEGRAPMVIEGLERLGAIDAFVTTDRAFIDERFLQRFRRYNQTKVMIVEEEILQLEERKMRAVASALARGSVQTVPVGGYDPPSNRPLYIVLLRR